MVHVGRADRGNMPRLQVMRAFKIICRLLQMTVMWDACDNFSPSRIKSYLVVDRWTVDRDHLRYMRNSYIPKYNPENYKA
jgi:hypothetical protein